MTTAPEVAWSSWKVPTALDVSPLIARGGSRAGQGASSSALWVSLEDGSGRVCRKPAAVAAPDGARSPKSPDPSIYPSIGLGHPFDPGGQSMAGSPVNVPMQLQPIPCRCGEHLHCERRNSRVDGRHESATLKNPMDQAREPDPRCVKKSLPSLQA